MTSHLGTLGGWLHFSALVAVIGAVLARWVLSPLAGGSALGRPARAADPGASQLRESLDGSAVRMGWAGAALLVVAMSLVFQRQLMEFRDPFATLSEDATLLLTGTSWGRSWITAAVASVALVVALTLARVGMRGSWWVATPLVLVVAAFPAATGHAAGTETLRPLTLAADWLHVLAAGGWIGGLGFLLYAERRWRRSTSPGSVLPVLVPVFSRVAMVAVGCLVVTGVMASWIHLGSFTDLVSTPYGRLLGGKLLLVGLVLGLGGVNWRFVTPQLEAPEGPRTLRRTALLEFTIAQVVLLVTAILVRTSPLDP